MIGLLLGQDKCSHRILRFGSGDYYVFCADCLRTWVQTKPGTNEANDEHLNNDVQGQDRVKIDE